MSWRGQNLEGIAAKSAGDLPAGSVVAESVTCVNRVLFLLPPANNAVACKKLPLASDYVVGPLCRVG